jgi:C-terminal processing protease CtpA/Prc
LRTGVTVYRNGSVGGEILSRFQVIFDFPREKIYLKPNGSLRRKFYYNMSGITVKAIGETLHNFEIVEVRKNSSANLSDIRVGDKIIAVNNNLTENMNLSEVNNYFDTKPGKKITLLILRGAVQMQKVFSLINEI